MMMMWPVPAEGKPFALPGEVEARAAFVRTAAQDGLPAPELEHGLWRHVLPLGAVLQAPYFTLVGDGDQGETLVLTDGGVVKRLPERHVRPYQSIFGEFAVERVGYGRREGQRIEAAPLDARLGLPNGKFS